MSNWLTKIITLLACKNLVPYYAVFFSPQKLELMKQFY